MKITVITSLYRCEKYLRNFLLHLNLIINKDEIEFILIHNKPSKIELQIINDFCRNNKINLLHIIIPKLETIYASWNRGIKSSSGKYISIWNVDDIRTPFSLYNQAEVLDSNEHLGFVYGDYIETPIYNIKDGNLIITPDKFKVSKFINHYHVGCFPMWRKGIHNIIGYFDEQFKSAGDYDFFIRVSTYFIGRKAKGLLGYYLSSTGVSKTGRINNIERTLIEIRYALFYKINYIFIFYLIRSYSVFYCTWESKVNFVGNYFKEYKIRFIKNVPTIIIGLFLFPFRYLIPTIFRYIKRYITNILLRYKHD